MDHLLSKDTFGPAASGSHGPHRPRPPPRRAHAGSPRGFHPLWHDRPLTPATGPVARPPEPRENPGRGGEPDGRTRRRNRPDPAGRGAWQTASCPAPWPVAGAGDPDAESAGPPGPGTASRPPALLSDNPVVCHTTKCGSGTISSPRTWTLRKGIVTGGGRRVARRRGRRHRTPRPHPTAPPAPSGPGRDAGSAWSSPEGHGGDA